MSQYINYGILAYTITIDNLKIIPPEYRDDRTLTDISNFILQGEFVHKYDKETLKKLRNTAIKIITKDRSVNVSYENIDFYREVNPVSNDEKE